MKLKKNNENSHLGKQNKWLLRFDTKYLLLVIFCQHSYRNVKHFYSFLFLQCTDDDTFSDVFCENSQKLINVHLFALAANYYSLLGLGVCTPLEDILEALRGESQGTSGTFTFVFNFLFIHYRTCGVLVLEGRLL